MIKAEDWLRACRDRVQQKLDLALEAPTRIPTNLHAAMRHAALNGGKRFRAALIYAAGQALGVKFEQLDPIAVAVELIHAYSLVHDDLPAMDDDDLRRGQPTLHITWDEATAILAGDALQALAFELLGKAIPGTSPAAQLRVIAEIANAIGSLGMAGGQALDLAAEGQSLTPEELETVHRAKTGRLIEASAIAPALLIDAAPEIQSALRNYARHVGFAFQVHDDVLDCVSDTETLGKAAGADEARDKSTYPAQLGIEGSRALADQLAEQAHTALKTISADTETLNVLASWVVQRSS